MNKVMESEMGRRNYKLGQNHHGKTTFEGSSCASSYHLLKVRGPGSGHGLEE